MQEVGLETNEGGFSLKNFEECFNNLNSEATSLLLLRALATHFLDSGMGNSSISATDLNHIPR